MNLENLKRVTDLSRDLKSIDNEISCVEGGRKCSVSFSIADKECGTSWFGGKHLSRTNRVKMNHLMALHLKEIRQEILQEIISLGVKP